MKVKIVKSNVQVVSNLDEEQVETLKSNLRLKNPAYLAALKFSKWGIPKTIPEYLKYYTILKEGTLLIPLGIDIKSILNLDSTEVDILDRRVINHVDYPKFNITLRDSQQEAFNSYLASKDEESNIITLPTGKGKTILGLALANELKSRTIVIVHKSDLVNGWIKDILECFPDLTKKDIGIFKAKSRTIGKQFTIATVQTLARLNEEDIHEFSKNFGFMILDEAHHVGASTFDIVNAFPAKNRLALTATPERADGLTELLHIFFGSFTYKFNMKTNGDKDILPVHVHVRTLSDVNYEPKFRAKNVNGKITYILDDDKGTIKYSNVTNKDVLPLIPILQTYGKIYNSDPFVNRLSIDIAKEYNEGRSIVVFVSLKEQCEYLMEQLILRGLDPQDVQIYNGDTKDKEKALNLAENNKNFITITTLKIATEGTNVKQWEVLFLATSIKDGKNVEQAVGRIRRVKEGKIPVAKVYDYHLPYCFSVNTHTNSRLNRYSKLNFKVSFSRDY